METQIQSPKHRKYRNSNRDNQIQKFKFKNSKTETQIQ